MGAFGAAFTLATNSDLLPMLISSEFTLRANFVTAGALSIMLGLITWAVLALARNLSGHHRRGVGVRAMESRAIVIAQFVFTVLVAAFRMVPAGLSILAGVTQNYFQGSPSGFTLRWVGEVLALYTDTIFLSIGIALATLVVDILIGVYAAWYLVSRPSRLSRAIEEIITLPISVPGLAIALALILVYGGVREFRLLWLFILVGHVLYTLSFMVRAVMAVLRGSWPNWH